MTVGWQKGSLLYEGKAKKIYSIEGDSGHIWVEFKNSLTAFNAQKKGSFEGKGEINRDIASILFRLLRKKDVASHWVEDVGANEMICRKLEMIPLEVVMRNNVAGSLAQRLGRQEGEELVHPVAEFFYKNDALQDPFINDDHAMLLGAAADRAELETIRQEARTINLHLSEIFAGMGVRLVDFKLEFGRDSSGRVLLADEITPDSCRLWDTATGEKLDKDRFRRDLGKVDESYREVLTRLRLKWGKDL